MNPSSEHPTESPADRELLITRVFDAPRHLVFEAWTKKEHIDRWCMPNGFTIEDSGADLRVGGAWRTVMRAPDGEEHHAYGVYREIIVDERLSFTHAWKEDDGTPEHETLVTILFADEGGNRTRMTFRQAFFRSTQSRDNHIGGWTQIFDRLADFSSATALKAAS